MEDIRQYEITRIYFNQGRWFVAFRGTFNGKKTMPRANYNWLLANPQFEDVPPGYCLHHLDCDEINDDVTNLALMKSNHHNAYHFKLNKDNNNERVKLRPPVRLGENPSVPKVYRMHSYKNTERWSFRWQETDFSGKRIDRQISRIKDKAFQTEKEAEKAKKLFMKIHPHFRKGQDVSKIDNLIYQINENIEPEEREDAYYLIKKVFPQI